MSAFTNRRSAITLFSSPVDVDSHRVRLVLAEKSIAHEVEYVDPASPPEDFLELNPYQTLPTLVDRDLVLYDGGVVIDYLDERFPHPPLMPVDPVSRARTRIALFRVLKDWYGLIGDLECGDPRRAGRAARRLGEGIVAADELFAHQPFFLSEELTVVDCTLVPLMWRLPHWGVTLPGAAPGFEAYRQRMLGRPAVTASLSEQEREMARQQV